MAKNKTKKRSISFILLTIVFVICVVGGYFVAKYLTQNDVFEVIGEKRIEIMVGQTYQDEGARAISFGKDISDKVKSESTVNNEVADTYYIKYTVDDIRYRGVERYRIVVVIDPSIEGGDNEGN